MRTTRKRACGRSPWALTTTLVLAFLAAVLLAGTASAAGHEGAGKSAKPGKPTAKAPKGAITQATPTFMWSKVSGATKYELRAYQDGTLLLKKTGIGKCSWKAVKALPMDVDLTWKVRASNAHGSGAWSKSRAFKVVPVELKIGDYYQGGKVAYIFQPGDPGYVTGATHGLIAATVDADSPTGRWANAYLNTGALETALGTGFSNTNKIIVAEGGSPSTYAAAVARAYESDGYTDWYLPSKDELNKLCLNQAAIGYWHEDYWSSSEIDAHTAWEQTFTNGQQLKAPKELTLETRAVRSF